jgi:hypothetical protein
MRFFNLSRIFGNTRISFITAALFVGMTALAGNVGAQEPPGSQTQIPESPGMAEHGEMPTPLHELVLEAEQKNPQIAASFHAWQASRNVPKQASALPETQLSVQQFSVAAHDLSRATATAISLTSGSAPRRTSHTQANGNCAPM